MGAFSFSCLRSVAFVWYVSDMTNTPSRTALISLIVNALLVIAVAVLAIELARPDPPPPVAHGTWVKIGGGLLTADPNGSVNWSPLPDVSVLAYSQTTPEVWRCLIMEKRYMASWRPASPALLVVTPSRADLLACGGSPRSLSF